MSQPDQTACPILARQSENGLELLAFRHPYAGTQLVRGVVREDETLQETAARALIATSGISITGAPLSLGSSNGIVPRETWNFFLFVCPPSAENWEHHCVEDDGHNYKFFWQPAEEYLEGDWPAPFVRALRFAAAKIDKLSLPRKNQYCEVQRPDIAAVIMKALSKQAEGKPIDPTEIARSIAGPDEKKWRQLMPTIRSEAIKLSLNGEATVLRKGKPVSGSDFKGLYKIGALQE